MDDKGIICSFKNLYRAYKKAKRGKGFNGSSARFQVMSLEGVHTLKKQHENGDYYTTRAQRTGCSMCGFGIHLEERPHRFDRLREDNYEEWLFWMYKCVTDKRTGEKYGWGKVLDYIGIGWEDTPPVQINLSDFIN